MRNPAPAFFFGTLPDPAHGRRLAAGGPRRQDAGMGTATFRFLPATRARALRHAMTVLATCACLLLASCKPAADDADAPPEAPGAAREPAEAVQKLARHLAHSDLHGFARSAVPPAEYVRLETAWRQGRSRWPLTELPLNAQLLPLLQTLASPGAATVLKASYDKQLANQHNDLRTAARNLALFGTRYVQEQPGYDDAQRRHYAAIIHALGEWAQHAPLGDPRRAHAAIDRLCRAASAVQVRDDDALNAAGMEASLRQLTPFFTELQAVLQESYNLPLRTSLLQLQAVLASERDDAAIVDVRYQLAGQEIATVALLERRSGRWYPAQYLDEARRILAEPPATGAAAETGAPAATP